MVVKINSRHILITKSLLSFSGIQNQLIHILRITSLRAVTLVSRWVYRFFFWPSLTFVSAMFKDGVHQIQFLHTLKTVLPVDFWWWLFDIFWYFILFALLATRTVRAVHPHRSGDRMSDTGWSKFFCVPPTVTPLVSHPLVSHPLGEPLQQCGGYCCKPLRVWHCDLHILTRRWSDRTQNASVQNGRP